MAQPPYRTIVEALDAGRGQHERGYTFILSDRTELFFSWDRLRLEAIKRAHHLRRLGLKKGDRMAMVIPEGEEFVPTFFGALWAGIVPVPLYPPLSLGKLDSYLEALGNILRKADPQLLVTTERVQKILWSVLNKVPSMRGGLVTVEQLAADAPGADEKPEALEVSDPAFLQFTSGSTSLPKGVVVTHGSLQANCWAIMREGLESEEDRDVGVSWLPLYHDMGLIGFVLAPMFHKVPVVFIPTLSFVKNCTIWMETIHRKRGTISFAPNFAYALITKRAKPEMLRSWDLSSMRAFGCGAEPIHADTMTRFVEAFQPAKLKPESLLPCYGMAEATLAISFVKLSDPLKADVLDARRYESEKVAAPVPAGSPLKTLEVVSCGRAFSSHEIGIFGEDGRRLPERTVGEIAFRGPSVAQGYFRDADATAKAIRDGWLFTGDLGYQVSGELFISGRKKDLIIVKGRNYDPQRIEWMVEEVKAVRKGSAVAFSRPGAESEELVIVCETRERDQAALRLSIAQLINEQMQLTVSDVVMLEPGSLPKTSSGKLQRQKTRSQYLDGSLGKEGVRTLGGTAQRLSLAKHFTLSLVGRGRHMARGLLRRTVGRARAENR